MEGLTCTGHFHRSAVYGRLEQRVPSDEGCLRCDLVGRSEEDTYVRQAVIGCLRSFGCYNIYGVWGLKAMCQTTALYNVLQYRTKNEGLSGRWSCDELLIFEVFDACIVRLLKS